MSLKSGVRKILAEPASQLDLISQEATNMNLMKNAIYSALEHTVYRKGVRRHINGVDILFPVKVARYYPDFYECEKLLVFEKYLKQGSLVMDVGAHIGLFTVLLSRIVGPTGRVIAFEPSPVNVKLLRQTIALNGLENRVDIRCQAVHERSELKQFCVLDGPASNANSFSPSCKGSWQEVSTVQLDSLENTNVGGIKIDAEGSEVAILRGGIRLFKRCRPICTIEIHPVQIALGGDDMRELIELLDSLGYKLYYQNRLVPHEWILSQRECFEVQAVPKEICSDTVL